LNIYRCSRSSETKNWLVTTEGRKRRQRPIIGGKEIKGKGIKGKEIKEKGNRGKINMIWENKPRKKNSIGGKDRGSKRNRKGTEERSRHTFTMEIFSMTSANSSWWELLLSLCAKSGFLWTKGKCRRKENIERLRKKEEGDKKCKKRQQ
jgi:hypothetical protein